MSEWAPGDMRTHIEFQHALNAELSDSGELVDKQGLASYRLVDVDSLERALDIAARSSAAPGPAGAPIKQPIEVRQVLGAPTPRCDPGARGGPAGPAGVLAHHGDLSPARRRIGRTGNLRVMRCTC
jgi:hypothetical protein